LFGKWSKGRAAQWLAVLPFFFFPQAWSQQGVPLPVFRWAGTLTDPRGAIEQAARRGVSFQYQYIDEVSQAPIGAPGSHDWYGRYTWTLAAAADMHQAMGWSGTSGFASMKEHAREFGRLYSGVAQGFSNQDAPARTALYEAWMEQSLLDGRLTLKAGRVDANTDFDAVPTAGDFLNSSMGYSPTIMGFPSYPQPQPAVELSVMPQKTTRAGVAEFRTAGGRLFLAEADRTWSVGRDARAGRAAVGGWRLTESLSRFDGVTASGTGGLYGVVEQVLWVQPEAGASARSLAAFLQVGTGDERVNPYSRHVGGGLVLTGTLHRRPHDSAGAAATWVRLAPETGGETAVEVYYKLNLSRAVWLVSDVQYFSHPDGIAVHGPSVVATPRLVFNF
jgi:carbohydrate-selective porin OprB